MSSSVVPSQRVRVVSGQSLCKSPRKAEPVDRSITTKSSSSSGGGYSKRTSGWGKQSVKIVREDDCDPTEECTEDYTESSWSVDDHHGPIVEVPSYPKQSDRNVRFASTPPTSEEEDEDSSSSTDSDFSPDSSWSEKSAWYLNEAKYSKPVFLRKFAAAATLIQSVMRGFLQRQAYTQFLIDYEVEVQVYKERIMKYEAARRIQTLVRCALSKRLVKHVRAALVIQPIVRGLVTRSKWRIPLLKHKVRLINQAKEQEMKEIRYKTGREIRVLKREADRKKEKLHEKSIALQKEQDAEQEVIRKLRKENKKLRAENEKLKNDMQDMRKQNFVLEESIKHFELETKKLQAALPKLEADHEHITNIEKQFRLRLQDYEASYEEGRELLEDEQKLKQMHWDTIVKIFKTTRSRQKELKKRGKREELAKHDETFVLHIRNVTKQMLHRDPMYENSLSCHNPQ